MRPKLTKRARKIILTKGAEKLGAFEEDDKVFIPFDRIELVRQTENTFTLSVYNKSMAIFNWDNLLSLDVGDTVIIRGFSKCAIELELE